MATYYVDYGAPKIATEANRSIFTVYIITIGLGCCANRRMATAAEVYH